MNIWSVISESHVGIVHVEWLIRNALMSCEVIYSFRLLSSLSASCFDGYHSNHMYINTFTDNDVNEGMLYMIRIYLYIMGLLYIRFTY